jgi:hypothetical protein
MFEDKEFWMGLAACIGAAAFGISMIIRAWKGTDGF